MEFEEPPALERVPNREYWRGVVRELRSNPGKAGKTGPYSVGVAHNIRSGKYVAFLPAALAKSYQWDERHEYMDRHWAVTTRKTESRDRQYVYVTWEGEGCKCRWCQ